MTRVMSATWPGRHGWKPELSLGEQQRPPSTGSPYHFRPRSPGFPRSRLTPGKPSRALTGTAVGSPNLNYQWQHLVGSVWQNIAATTSTAVLHNVTADDAGQYRLVVSNALGSSTTNPVTVSVNVPQTAPRILVQPDQSAGAARTVSDLPGDRDRRGPAEIPVAALGGRNLAKRGPQRAFVHHRPGRAACTRPLSGCHLKHRWQGDKPNRLPVPQTGLSGSPTQPPRSRPRLVSIAMTGRGMHLRKWPWNCESTVTGETHAVSEEQRRGTPRSQR